MKALPAGVRAVLLDIEGTVGDIAFVKTVLFPYARARMADYVRAHRNSPEVARIVGDTLAETGDARLDLESVIGTLQGWSDADRKIGPLKALQGLVWRQGYEDGTLRSHLYPDAVDFMRAAHAADLTLAIYSSGSVGAQKLYFGYAEAGDLTPLLSGYFDTATGAKGEAASYAKIAQSLGRAPAEIVFYSDMPAEIAAAQAAGLHAIRIDRGKKPPESGDDSGGRWWGSFAPAL